LGRSAVDGGGPWRPDRLRQVEAHFHEGLCLNVVEVAKRILVTVFVGAVFNGFAELAARLAAGRALFRSADHGGENMLTATLTIRRRIPFSICTNPVTVWFALHRDGERVELRQCYDFITIGKSRSSDLTSEQKREMANFVRRE
jgi:hypothetical protein